MPREQLPPAPSDVFVVFRVECQGLNEVIRVDSGVDSAEFPSGRKPLKSTRFALVFGSKTQGHVANLPRI